MTDSTLVNYHKELADDYKRRAEEHKFLASDGESKASYHKERAETLVREQKEITNEGGSK